jgi:hypothetical protein
VNAHKGLREAVCRKVTFEKFRAVIMKIAFGSNIRNYLRISLSGKGAKISVSPYLEINRRIWEYLENRKRGRFCLFALTQ